MSKEIRYIVIKPDEPKNPVDIPVDLITDKNVSNGAFKLYGLVAGADDSELPDKWYAEQMDISMATLYRYKKELREAGYIY